MSCTAAAAAAATSSILSSSCIRIDNTILLLPGRHHHDDAAVVNYNNPSAFFAHRPRLHYQITPPKCRHHFLHCLPPPAHGSSDPPGSSVEQQGSGENNESQAKSSSSSEILKKLSRYGLSGILSYGLLNTAYYLSAFLVAWFYIAPAPGKMGYFTAVKRFVKLMAMVWAGSQVTKLLRAGGALALAPVVDKGLSWFMSKFKFKSQAKAFTVIVGCCFGLAAVMFIAVMLLSA